MHRDARTGLLLPGCHKPLWLIPCSFYALHTADKIERINLTRILKTFCFYFPEFHLIFPWFLHIQRNKISTTMTLNEMVTHFFYSNWINKAFKNEAVFLVLFNNTPVEMFESFDGMQGMLWKQWQICCHGVARYRKRQKSYFITRIVHILFFKYLIAHSASLKSS